MPGKQSFQWQTCQRGNGRPLFLDNPQESIIYTCAHSDYMKMNDSTVQGIFRSQNMVITGCPEPKVKFDLAGLKTLGDLDKPIDVQGKYWGHSLL